MLEDLSRNLNIMIKKYYHLIRTKIHILVLRSRRFKSEDAILICSETRGGSTWLMELMRNISGSTTIWEPLYPEKGVVPRDYNFGWRPNILEEQLDSRFKLLFKKILKGSIQSQFTLSETSILRSIFSRYLIIKFTRAHLLLPWLVSNFSLKYRPIFLVRHPIAVAFSQVKAFA